MKEHTRIALLVVYNHRYDKNIPIIQRLYEKRFSHIYHLVPFYNGNIENVITVYENSFYFQSYIAQAYQQIKKQDFTHFYIIADDLIVNPEINENNLFDKIGIAKDECWLPARLKSLHKKEITLWCHIFSAIEYNTKKDGVDVTGILPKKEQAEKIFRSKNLQIGKIPLKVFFNWFKDNIRIITPKLIKNIFWILFDRRLKYPLIGGYSDTFIVTSDVMPKFANYCGAFAASKLFVEIAIPTSMVLAANKLKIGQNEPTVNNTTNKGIEKFNYSLEALLDNFPKCQYLHPIKLSKWTFTV